MADRHCTKVVDVTGQRFGRLVVVAPSERMSLAGKLWRCVCDCGGETVTTSLKLRRGHTSSCGCLQRETIAASHRTHGKTGTRTYRTWKEMRQRCTNPHGDKWKWYGGRGITICERWSSFDGFVADMGERPDGMTLDRIDPDGNYEPNNCRWATPKQQAETNRGIIKPGSSPSNKIPSETRQSMRDARAAGLSLRELAERFGVAVTTACQITKAR